MVFVAAAMWVSALHYKPLTFGCHPTEALGPDGPLPEAQQPFHICMTRVAPAREAVDRHRHAVKVAETAGVSMLGVTLIGTGIATGRSGLGSESGMTAATVLV